MSESDWIESSAKNPCPVCGRNERDCLIHSDRRTVRCKTRATGSAKWATPPDEVGDYKFTGRIETSGVHDRAVYSIPGTKIADSVFTKASKKSPKSSKSFMKPATVPAKATEKKVKVAKARKEEAGTHIFVYPAASGENACRVVRVDDGAGNKRIWQEYWIKDDRLSRHSKDGWVSVSDTKVKDGRATAEERALYLELAKPIQESLHLYRIEEAIALHESSKLPLLVVEGELKVHSLLALGIPATCCIGGSNKFEDYGGENYLEDLARVEESMLVVCPDRDAPGMKYAESLTDLYPAAKLLYCEPTSPNWIAPSDGYDIKNWIDELRESGKSDEEIKNSILDSVCDRRTIKLSTEFLDENPEIDYEIRTTSDEWVFSQVFQAGQGKWVVIADAFYYDQGHCWELVPDARIEKIIGHQLRYAYTLKQNKKGEYRVYNHTSDSKVRSAFGYSRKTLNVGQEIEPNGLMAFRNCVLDTKNMRVMPHSPLYYLTTVVDADYIPNQECPEIFLNFISTSFGDELIPLIRACTAMMLCDDVGVHRFPHVMGPSRSGKGVLLRFWASLFGEKHSRSGGSFGEITTPEGRHQNLTGTRYFYLPDIGGFIQGVRPFYELVDNGRMGGRALYSSNGYQKKWNVRFAVGSVSPLQVENSGDGWDERVIVIPTKETIKNRDPWLEKKITTPEARAAIISWALAMDSEHRDAILKDPGSVCTRVREAQWDTSLAGDPIKSFVDHCLRPVEGGKKIRSEQLHSWFCAYAEAFGYSKVGEKKFAAHLKTVIGKHYQERHRAVKGRGEIGDSANGMVAAGWVNLAPLPELFSFNAQLGHHSINKGLVQEGGLYEFMEFCVSANLESIADTPKQLVEQSQPSQPDKPAEPSSQPPSEQEQPSETTDRPSITVGSIVYTPAGDLGLDPAEVQEIDDEGWVRVMGEWSGGSYRPENLLLALPEIPSEDLRRGFKEGDYVNVSGHEPVFQIRSLSTALNGVKKCVASVLNLGTNKTIIVGIEYLSKVQQE